MSKLSILLVFFVNRFTLHGHNRGPDNISLSEDGRRAVTYDSSRRDTTLWMWDLHKGKISTIITLTLLAHSYYSHFQSN